MAWFHEFSLRVLFHTHSARGIKTPWLNVRFSVSAFPEAVRFSIPLFYFSDISELELTILCFRFAADVYALVRRVVSPTSRFGARRLCAASPS
ncbi:MAG: hypothetical protein [Cressdnaviricota sp.]|nr:MAG: hypothetical protein [Cressdnaviricota sp.]